MRSAALFCLFFLGLTSAKAQDLQSWNEVDLAASWRNVEFLVPLLARTDTRLPNPQLAATGITADLSLPWHLTLTAGYLFADLPQSSLASAPSRWSASEVVPFGAFLDRGPKSL